MLKSIHVVLLVFLVAALAQEASAQRQSITIGTGRITGVYYPTGGAICRLMNRNRNIHGIRCSVETSGGSIYNLNSIQEGRYQFGLARSDILYKKFNSSGTKQLRAVFSVHSESLTIVARQDSGIRTLRDLAGKRVNIGTRGSPEREAMDTVMKAMRWNTKSFRYAAELPSAEQVQALKYRNIDAAVFMVGHPSGRIKEVTASCDTVIVPVTGTSLARLIQATPYYRPARIPGGIYCGNGEQVESFGVATTVVTSSQVPSHVVYRLVESVFNQFDQFRKLHPAFSTLNPVESANTGVPVPQHIGALKYFKERGYK